MGSNFFIGKFVRYFILSDLFLLAGWGLISPLFSIYVLQRIQGATLVTVGILAAIYWLPKSLIQIPIALFLDKTPSERDDYLVLVSGLVLAGLTALSFAFIDKLWQLYATQLLQAFSFSLYVPAWSGMFSRHLDKGHHSLDYTLDSAVVGLASGLTGLGSGILVTWFGFNTIFFLGAVFCFLSAVIIFFVPHMIFPHRRHRGIIVRDHTPKFIRH